MAYSKKYLLTIRELSDRLVNAQHPIRILDAVKWDDGIRRDFFKHNFKILPKVNTDYYSNHAPGFVAAKKRAELLDLELLIKKRLGEYDPVGAIMRRICAEYIEAVRMIEARGTADFSRFSQDLYGSAHDVFYEGEPTLAEFGAAIGDALHVVDQSKSLPAEEQIIRAPEAAQFLQKRLAKSFTSDREIHVRINDNLEADAAAGADHITLRGDAVFSERELRLLEVHEGWVHVGTTLNGLAQPYCTFLSKGSPSATVTQEGLAVLLEVLAFVSYPQRVARISNRICAVAMAEDGADFLDVFKFYREQGISDDECYASTQRVFRGSTPEGQPFTKDISYCKGFILVYNYLQLAVREGKLDRIPLLFCGKTTLEDLRALRHLLDEEVVVPPRHLPPQFKDMNALASWMCFSSFLRNLDLKHIEEQYREILS